MGTYTITTTENQDKFLLYTIPDVKKWFQDMADGKINNCTKTFMRDWTTILNEDSTVLTMPATETEFLNKVFARVDYKDRATRDTEEQAKADAREEAQRLKKEADEKAKAKAQAAEDKATAEALVIKEASDAAALAEAIEAGVRAVLAEQ